MTPPGLQALNRYENTHYRVTQHALAWADEGTNEKPTGIRHD